MAITQKEFGEAFVAMATGKMSPAEFSNLTMEWFKSPDYNRWKAAQAAEDLKRWSEGRDHLMKLIEDEKKAGTDIDYEILQLREGHDSVKVIVNGRATVCFPSFFPKEFIDMNWTHVLEGKERARRACGRADCGTSTSIDEVTLTFGGGNLDEHGFWEFPCIQCAEAFQKANPKYKVWPVKDAAQ
jgi:hypothetical protein